MRSLSVAGAGIALLVDVAYIAIIGSQRAELAISLRVPFVAAFIAILALAAGLAGRRAADRWAPLLLGFSAAGLLTLGVLAAFSIGIGLLLAAIPVLAAAALVLRRKRAASDFVQVLGGLVAALAILLLGIQLTELPVGCPSTGYSSGGGTGLFGSPYHWTCANGRLTTGAGVCTQGGASVDPSGHVVATSGC